MIKESILFLSLMGAGTGLLGLALGAWTPTFNPSIPAAEDVPSPPVDLPTEVVFEGRLPVSRPAPLAPKASTPRRATKADAPTAVLVEPKKPQPCGEWTEIGAIYRSDQGATGVHRVRPLCF